MLCGLFAGCSNTTPTQAPTQTPTQTPTQDPGTQTPEPTEYVFETDEVVNLTYWVTWTAGYTNTAANLAVEDFNELYKDQIFVKSEYNSAALAGILTAHKSGTTPEVFVLYFSYQANYYHQGLMVDLLPYARRTGFDFDDFNSAFWSHCTYGEAVTGLPMSPSGIVLVYNETMYQDKLGHTKSPKTLDELFEFSKKLTVKDGNKTKVYGFTFDRSDGTFIETLGRAFGAVWFGENGVGCPGAYDGTVKKAYQYLRDFVDSGTFYQPATANTNMSNIAAFNSGVVAQICTFVSQIKNIWMLGKNKKFGIDLMPGVTEGQTGYQQIGGQANSISSLTTEKEREAGWLFIEYCVSPEQEIKWGITASTPVRRSSSNQLPELIKYWEENPQLFVGYRLVQAAQDEPYPLSLNQFSSDRTSVVDMVIYEGMSAEKAVLLVQESAEEYLVDTRPTSVIPKTNP